MEAFFEWMRDTWFAPIGPLIALYFAAELPTLLRRFYREYYVPLYFSIAPLDVINKEIAVYLGRHYMIGHVDFSAEEYEEMLPRIKRRAVALLVFSSAVWPSIIGALAAFFLAPIHVGAFVLLFLLLRAEKIFNAWVDTRVHGGIYPPVSRISYALIYVFYLCGFVLSFRAAHKNAYRFTSVADYVGLIDDYIGHLQALFFLIVVTLIATVLVNLFINPRTQKQSFEQIEENAERAEVEEEPPIPDGLNKQDDEV
jgi:hypothetical protein